MDFPRLRQQQRWKSPRVMAGHRASVKTGVAFPVAIDSQTMFCDAVRREQDQI
jgi:hypothetical protein